jgi:hypothetical protein
VGYVSVVYGDLLLDGIVLRRDHRRTGSRSELPGPNRPKPAVEALLHPPRVNDEVRKTIEAELLWQLGEREEFTP